MSKSKYNPDEKTSIDPAFFDRSQQEPFSISKFIYNKKDGSYFGRTTESWGKHKHRMCDFFLIGKSLVNSKCELVGTNLFILCNKSKVKM